MRMQTQWRVGMNGPTGLDYNVLFRFLDRMDLDADDYDEMIADVQVMELEALNTINRKKD